MARSSCSDCGSTGILWTTAIDLPWRLTTPQGAAFGIRPAVDALEERKRLWDAINWCGPDAEAWWCPLCAAWGVFTDEERAL